MNTGLLLVTHAEIATALLNQARRILDSPMDAVRVIEIGVDAANNKSALRKAVEELDQGNGVLIMTDLPGATPSNLVLTAVCDRCTIVSGLNLPMLIRAWNYRSRGADELGRLAMDGAKAAILELT